jgi:hypothetical protein
MYSVKHLYSRANELLELDTKIGRLDNNIKYYEFGLRRAEKTGNKVKYTILLNRYIDAKIQRRLFNNNLKKTLNSAKYINFGN